MDPAMGEFGKFDQVPRYRRGCVDGEVCGVSAALRVFLSRPALVRYEARGGSCCYYCAVAAFAGRCVLLDMVVPQPSARVRKAFVLWYACALRFPWDDDDVELSGYKRCGACARQAPCIIRASDAGRCCKWGVCHAHHLTTRRCRWLRTREGGGVCACKGHLHLFIIYSRTRRKLAGLPISMSAVLSAAVETGALGLPYSLLPDDDCYISFFPFPSRHSISIMNASWVLHLG